ncbi:MAG: hypothetical protein ACLQVI_42995 [Polyangiaceae bacterium]
MKRWIIFAVAIGAITALSAGPGCAATGVGDPCTPDEEYTQSFQAFSIEDVNVESKSYVCLTRLCLVNHFQGRVTCPYGQSAPNVGPMGPSGSNAAAVNSEYGCAVPGAVPGPNGLAADDQITATNVSVAGFSAGQVPPQFVGTGAADRTANKTVYCSCRCANVEGSTSDGAVYCACPENYTCTPLVSSIGASDTGLTGSYCVLNGTQYNPALATNETCEAIVTNSAQPGYCPLQY